MTDVVQNNRGQVYDLHMKGIKEELKKGGDVQKAQVLATVLLAEQLFNVVTELKILREEAKLHREETAEVSHAIRDLTQTYEEWEKKL